MNVIWVPSPNSAAREPDCVVDTIVLHATVLETVELVIEHFQKEVPGVSAHYTIERDGRVYQHVDESMLAFHAGVSLMSDGRESVNSFSIGIELVNRNDGIDPYPEGQLSALDVLIGELKARHPIKHLAGHWEIAIPAGRKTDPAGLDLDALREKSALDS